MGWAEDARQKRRAPIGLYEPERYTVTVYDTFQQYKLRMAALAIANGMSVPQFYAFCADYVIDHHRKLRHFKGVFRKGAREILAAVYAPIGDEFMEPESERTRRRREAFYRFTDWAYSALFPRKEEER